jgi:hypothetical protein
VAVAWRSTGTEATRASPDTSTLTVTQPTGHALGDVLLLVASSFNAAGSSPVSINTPAGWTLISNSGAWAINNKANTSAYYKIDGGSEGSVAMTTGAASFLDAQISAFSSGNISQPLNANTGWSPSGANSVSFTYQAITTTAANCLLLSLITDVDGSSYSPASGYTERSETIGNVFVFVWNTKTLVAAGNDPSTTCVKSNSGLNGGNGIMLALGPPDVFVPQVVAFL